jgi:acyl dehydratase
VTGPARGERLPASTFGPLDAAAVEAYAGASGDSNPIHLAADAAAAAGLAGPIVQGMLVMGHMVRLAEGWRADAEVCSAKVLFLRPVSVGESLRIDGRVVDVGDGAPAWRCTLRLTARSVGGTIVALVDVVLAAAPAGGPADRS